MSNKDRFVLDTLIRITRALENIHMLQVVDPEVTAEIKYEILDQILDDIKCAKRAVGEVAGQPWELTSNAEHGRRLKRN